MNETKGNWFYVPSLLQLSYDGSYVCSDENYHYFRYDNNFYKVYKQSGTVLPVQESDLPELMSA